MSAEEEKMEKKKIEQVCQLVEDATTKLLRTKREVSGLNKEYK